MRHPIIRHYKRSVFVLMGLYVVLVFVVLPYARHAESAWLKVVLSMLPVSPVIAVLWLVALRVLHSDELEQRLHLLALSVATGVVAAATLIGGFLCTVGAIALDGDVLIWVLPALCFSYGISRLLFARRYGGSGCEE